MNPVTDKMRSNLKIAASLACLCACLLAVMVMTPFPVTQAQTRRAVTADTESLVGEMRPQFEAGPVSDDLGMSVAVSGDVAMVGATGVNNDAGAVYIYLRRTGSWRLQAILTAPKSVPSNKFGYDIAMSGNTALIGASGDAYVYAGSGSNWTLQATLTSPGARDQYFGVAVALFGSTALVGAPVRSAQGRAYFYHRTGKKWHLQATVSNPLNEFTNFGDDVAVSGSTAVIGALGPSGFADEKAYIYRRTGASWQLRTKLSYYPPDLGGPQVAVFGTTVTRRRPWRCRVRLRTVGIGLEASAHDHRSWQES